jgi:hypothetical protein
MSRIVGDVKDKVSGIDRHDQGIGTETRCRCFVQETTAGDQKKLQGNTVWVKAIIKTPVRGGDLVEYDQRWTPTSRRCQHQMWALSITNLMNSRRWINLVDWQPGVGLPYAISTARQPRV